MNYNFSDRISSLKPSAIREILKFTAGSDIISFSAGNPSPDAFPTSEIAEITAKIFREKPIRALQYSVTEGYTPLRETVRTAMKEKLNIGREFDDVIITAGAQQVMELSAKVLCNEGDTIICESPSFIGSLNAFRSFGIKLCGIDIEDDGMNMEQLEAALRENKNVRLIYTIPNFQNPSGVTMSLLKRKQLYSLAKKYGVLIIEDNPYGELRFSGGDIPTIKSMDEDGIVIYAGSFSKVISPGLRVGWCVAPAEIISKMVVCKQTGDVHTNILGQMIANEFVNNYDFEAHLSKLREIYRVKAELMMNCLRTELGGKISFVPVEGGLFLWVKLPDTVDIADFCRLAKENGVAVVPGNAFLTDENASCQAIRINYSTPTNEQIIRGVTLLGKTAEKI